MEKKLQDFYKEVASSLEEEIEVDIRPIKIDQLSEAKLSPNEIQYIDFIIEKEPE
jgi:hypothetical protein